MASGSSSATIVESSTAGTNRYDVFLSFRGEDTRDSFTDHLYHALKRAGIVTFMDDEEIKRGEELMPEIEGAIKESKASIVVLSENYATSTWCLDELRLILEQRKKGNHFVLPVFYHVEPSDVGKQNKTFAIEVKASSRWTNGNVKLWKNALREVAVLAGMVLLGSETKFLKEVVDTIYNKLDRKEVHLPINLTGMDARYNEMEINSWIKGSNVTVLAIYGMGGSGKTTLAKYIYDSNWKSFENRSFVEGIGVTCKGPEKLHRLLELQEQLLRDISGGRKRIVPGVSQGTSKIKDMLKTTRALIVLDDIVETAQLVALLGTSEIDARSKIIITTRLRNIDEWFEARSLGYQKHIMKLLDDDESLELLCRHAFRSKIPMEGFNELAVQAAHFCKGNPLALETLGSSLFVSADSTMTNNTLFWKSKNTLFWKSKLSSLERQIDSGIERVLISSYESLPHPANQELFLHIACFFIGADVEYVARILEDDFSAFFGIQTLTDRCLISVSPNNKIMMHPLLQEMGRTIVHKQSENDPAQRTRVWRNEDSHDVLRKGEGSTTIEGLALDMRMLKEHKEEVKTSNLKTDALKKMDKLKLLQLNFVQLSGSYENFSEDLRWLCWFGFHKKTIPLELSMGKLVAIDMSDSKLEVFDPPMVLRSLQILNLKDSHNLFEIRNLSRIPHLETLILWNCHSLVRVCDSIGDLTSLALLNMTGCKNLCKREERNLFVRLVTSPFSGGAEKQSTFSFPRSLHRLFLKDCNLEFNDSFPLSFSAQPSLEYLNLGSSLFEFLPHFDHLKNLRVLDLSLCSRLKWLLCLPSTLAELYVYECRSLKAITFVSPRFTLQEFGCEGCVSLSEIEGFIKLEPVTKLDENDLGHMKWLKEYQNHEVCLVGDVELTKGRSSYVQMLYEFGIMSTSLPNIMDRNMKPTYVSELSSLSFDVPSCPKNRKLTGLDVIFKYSILSDDCAWFCKISTSNGVDLMYNPKVFGKPELGKAGIWLSYWPIGNTLGTGDKVSISIAVLNGLKVHGCGVSLVYADDKVATESLENNMGWIETLGGDLSRFQLSTGAYYLCRRDFNKLMEVGMLTPGWFRILVGNSVDETEVCGWGKTGGPQQSSRSITQLKTVGRIIHGPESEDKTLEVASRMVGETIEPATSSKFSDTISMASGSSSSTMASPGANASSYDVFLSFRGDDTRYAFTDHLYDALKRAGISIFRDNEEINRGEELKPEIQRAIKESRASIVILSKEYATSTWCLDELLLILQQKRECNHFVLPVYYHVDPSDVRKQNKTFAIEVKASSRWTDDNVNLWKKALREVADLSGLVSFRPDQAKFLKEIVDAIYYKLDLKEVHLPPNLTGMATRYAEINSWLNQSNVEFLAICGMGGSGKTTLAKYIYNLNWNCFENTSFIEQVGGRCKEPHGLLELQEQLLRDISGGRRRKVPSVSQSTSMLEEALQTKRTFIVLDGITEDYQLYALLGTGKMNAQSKIIITTSVLSIEEWFESRSWGYQKYKMRLLNDDESIELLSRHAFGSSIPMEDFGELALQAIRYCEGNPLALEVLGSSLSVSGNNINHWKSTLNLLERDIHHVIQSVLIRSYNSLPYESSKELFLHIACFFVGEDKDYVEMILEHDYSASSGIKLLCNRGLLSVSPTKKLMMHRLLQEMGRTIVRQESKDPAKCSRVWLSSDSYNILIKRKGSNTMEGFALDMQMLPAEKFPVKSSSLTTDALKRMDKLKLLQLNFVQLTGSYEDFSEDLRWLCWHGFHLRTIPSDLFMGNLVALDMSYSNLEVFEPPMVLQSLKILNLKDSRNLVEIRNMSMIPHLETLILWYCHSLVHVCATIVDLKGLVLLKMTGCEKLCMRELEASTSGGGTVEQRTFSFLPHSLHRLFLNDCNLECNDSFPLSFSDQLSLEYLNLCNNQFEFLPDYNHLKNLRVLDLSLCSRLKQLTCLPRTLAELYVSYCKSLERITFESPRFTLQEFNYEGCVSLSEVEGFIQLIGVTKLDKFDLGHMKWLKDYQSRKVCLVGDDELTIGRSFFIQMLYEFGIMSTSLPDIKDPNMMPDYVSNISSLSFDVPSCPTNRWLKGLDVSFRYTISSDDDFVWFCKITTSNGVDLMYNPKVFGKPDSGKVGTWFSYWPIGNTLHTGDQVMVSIIAMSGLEVHECGVSLVYTDDEVAMETLENNMGWEEILGGDLSGFQLSTGAYYLCRRNFFELMEVGRITPDWFTILVGDTVDVKEVRGWRKTGRPKEFNPSFTELNVVRRIIEDPALELNEIQNVESMDISKAAVSDEIKESTSIPTHYATCHIKKIVLGLDLCSRTKRQKVMKALSDVNGIESIDINKKDGRLTVVGDVDPVDVLRCVRKIEDIVIISIARANESEKEYDTGLFTRLPVQKFLQYIQSCSVL